MSLGLGKVVGVLVEILEHGETARVQEQERTELKAQRYLKSATPWFKAVCLQHG